MRFNRSEYSRFVQRLDRTAEKNPVLWLPCIILLAVIVGFGELRETVKIAFSRPERHTSGGKSSAAECKAYQKPFLFRAAAMSLACAFGFMFMSDLGLIAYADEFNDDPSYTDWQNDISVTGNDPFGNMLADEFNSKSNEQEANAGYNVFSVEMQGNTAVVDYEAIQNSTLVVGIYDESGNQLITTGSAQVTADENQATVELDSSKIPQYFYIKAYLINTETMRPLCTVYECPTYTQEMQDFLSKTVLDFDTDRVLNLDTDISNNFAVFSEDAVISQETVSHNNVVSVDNDRNVYVIENADDIVKNLQSGDVYSQEYGNNEVLVVKVASVDVIDNTVTIYGDDSALEDVFEYVKIDSTFSSSDVVADMSTLEEGVEYNYTGGIATYAVDVGGGVSYDHKFKFTDKDIENYKDETTSAKVNLNGSLDLHLGGRAKLYISWSQTYVELVLDYSAKLQLTFSESLHGKIPLIHFEVSPCAGVYIKFDPSIVVELDGKISLAGELSGSYGFKADKNGAHNISQSPRFTHELSAVGTFYIGVSLEPKVSIISEKLVNAYINGRMGVEVKASLKYGSTDENNGIQHDCKSCIDGDISIKFNLSAGIKLLNDKLSFNIDLINKQVKIADFYRSDDFGDSGFTKCPHYSYKVSAHIYGEHGAPPKETKIECSNGNVYTTDINGRVDFYLPNGEYWFKISNDKYSSSDYAKIHNKPTTISAWLDSTFAHSSSGGGGSVEPIDPTPIDPNPVDPDPTPTESDFIYSISNGEVTITGYKGIDTEVVIPDTIEGVPVTSIGNRAFQYCRNLTSITIPNSVTSIGSSHYGSDGAFYGCTSLTSITIPDSVTYIGPETFLCCTSLTNITVDTNNTNYSSLDGVLFNKDLSILIQYPVGLTGKYSYTIPDGVTDIDHGAFLGCKDLTNIIIPNSVTDIYSFAFQECTNLTSITIPNEVRIIGADTFKGCTSLTDINLSNITYICGGAFWDCTSLVNVNIPESVTRMDDQVFWNCTSLVNINVDLNNKVYSSLDGVLFNKDFSQLIAYPSGKNGVYTIPNNVTSIGNYAFSNCANLINIAIPDGITSIGYWTFKNCINFTSINIPNNVTNISGAAFDNCPNLTIYCNQNSYAETYAIEEGIPYVIIDNPAENTAQFEGDETETTPVIDTETNGDIIDNDDSNDYPIENLEDTKNNETDLQAIIAAVTETPEVYNSYDKPIYLKSAMDISVSQTFTGLIPNEVYNCYGMKSRKAEDPFNGSNLLFIVQTVSDSNGNLTFSYLPDEGYSNPQIFVKAMTEFDVYNATIIYAEENDGSVSIGWNPVDGASQYKVYKVVNNVYVEYQTVTATNCTVTGLSADTKCGFIVQTCIHGEWSVLFGKDVLYYNASAGEHKHEFGTVWKSDENSHWHECSCGEKADNAPHSFDSGVITLKPTETTEGIMTYTCTVCGYSYTTAIFPEDPDHTEHTFDTIWHSDATSHWHECTVCGIHSDTANHTENRGVVTTLPTATTPGIRMYSCSVCGYVMRTETILATGGGSTVNPDPPSPSYPDVTPPSVTYPNGTGTPAAKEPYIYGDTSKSGWDAVISEIDFAPDGSTVKVNMNGMTELPKAVVSHIQNRSIILELSVSGAVWTIDGLDVTEPKTVDLRVSNTNKIPASVIESLNSNPKAKQLRLYHNGDLGFRATLTLNIGNRYNGYYAVLYYYNTSEIKPEFIGESLAQNGKVQFEISHASYYILTFSNKSVFEDVGAGAGEYADSEPIETPVSKSNAPVREFLPIDRKCFSTKKRRYRIIKR